MESELHQLSEAMTMPRPRECLACYVLRMLEFGCHGRHWMGRYRAMRAPRATALERRMAQKGGYCDCEMLMNVVFPNPRYFRVDEDGDIVIDPKPPCLGVRGGSTQPCALWVGRGLGRGLYSF
ncbi:DUF2695 domain-containing protein [Arthrobacter sp. AETb3-4]|uniref:DUF2695 domain-containing protein n=2 Tax=Arthrobacter wenxiniae TaxID=2713570 RepID=A0A7Y7IJ95_9MICC|nr:DUF2695 domain-containing protein [Arthrobacter wenxiniae]